MTAQEILTTTPPGLRKLANIFSIDDDPNDVLLLRTALKAVGYSGGISFATDGQEAIEMLDAPENPTRPDLILLDLNMPRRNGFECLQWIRSHKDHQSVPIAILTTSAHSEDIRRSYELGADLFLVKPLLYEDLLALAETILAALEDGDSDFSALKETPAFRQKPWSENLLDG